MAGEPLYGEPVYGVKTGDWFALTSERRWSISLRMSRIWRSISAWRWMYFASCSCSQASLLVRSISWACFVCFVDATRATSSCTAVMAPGEGFGRVLAGSKT